MLRRAGLRFCDEQVQEPLNACSIAVRLSGSESGLGMLLNAFHGQMGCIYLFEDILSSGSRPLLCSVPSSSHFRRIAMALRACVCRSARV
jgi:hypothetical protein